MRRQRPRQRYWAVKVEQVIVDGTTLRPEPMLLISEAERGGFPATSGGHVYLFPSHPVSTTESAWGFVFETTPSKAELYLVPRASSTIEIRYYIAYKTGGRSQSQWLLSTNIYPQDLTTRPARTSAASPRSDVAGLAATQPANSG